MNFMICFPDHVQDPTHVCLCSFSDRPFSVILCSAMQSRLPGLYPICGVPFLVHFIIVLGVLLEGSVVPSFSVFLTDVLVVYEAVWPSLPPMTVAHPGFRCRVLCSSLSWTPLNAWHCRGRSLRPHLNPAGHELSVSISGGEPSICTWEILNTRMF